MNCSEARDLLSPYLDGELSADRHESVAAHVESCPECAGELASFQSLSQSASGLRHPEVPPEIWQKVASELDAKGPTNLEAVDLITNPHRPISRLGASPGFFSVLGSFQKPGLAPKRLTKSTAPLEEEAGSVLVESGCTPAGSTFRWASIAAIALLAITLGFLGYHNLQHEHDELAADFSEYLDAFQQTPAEAHLVLVNKYAGRAVELKVARDDLGYRPTIADGLPDDYAIQDSYVLDMPCCKCIESVCTRADGSILAIFEHNDEQPIWFGDRRSIQTQCAGQDCTVTRLNGQIAVSWRNGSRHLTVVGAKGVDEAAEIISHLSSPA